MRQTFKKKLDVFTLIVSVLFASTSSAFASTTEACANANATPLELDSTYRGYASEGTEILVLDIPAAGIAALDVTVPGTAQAEPKLGFLGHRCSTAADPDAATIEKSVAQQTIAFRAAGAYYIRVAAQDPQQALGDYKVHTRFVATQVVDDTFEAELGQNRERALVRQTDFFADSATKGQVPLLSLFTAYDPGPQGLEDEEVDPDPNGLEDEEVDPDPNGFATNSSASTRGPQGLEDEEVDPDPNGLEDEEVDPDPNGFATNSSASTRGPQGLEDEEVDPDPNGLEDEEVDPDPNGFATSSSASTRGPQGLEDEEVDPDPNGFAGGERILDSMVVVDGRDTLDVDFCEGRDADDHQDVFACATSVTLGTSVSGRLANDWHDDIDVFSIELTSPATLQIATRGRGDTIGGLYDSFGQRLAVDDDGGDGANSRIVKSLQAGRYFIRVEGGGSPETSYALTVQALAW